MLFHLLYFSAPCIYFQLCCFFCLNLIILFFLNVGLMFSVFKLQCESLFALHYFSSGFAHMVLFPLWLVKPCVLVRAFRKVCRFPEVQNKYPFLQRDEVFDSAWCLEDCHFGVSKIRFLAWGSSAPSRLRCKPNESHTMGGMSQDHFVFFLFKLGSTPKYFFLVTCFF